jgi:hypothetical protein
MMTGIRGALWQDQGAACTHDAAYREKRAGQAHSLDGDADGVHAEQIGFRDLMTDTKCNTNLLQYRTRRTALHEAIRFTRQFARVQLKKVRAITGNYLADYTIEQNGEQKWVENPAKRVIHGIYDAVSEPIRSGHWKVPRLGNDRTTYVVGLYGTGRFYIHALMLRNLGPRAKYIRERIRFHPRPTSMIYTGHATMRYASRGQRLPAVTSRILGAVESGFADLIFVYRHPLDSLLTNWVWWRTYIREKRIIDSISDVYKNTDDLCAALERDFRGFKTFAEGDPVFFSDSRGPRFLSFPEFVEETALFLESATLTVRLEDCMIDPLKEFSKIVEIMSVRVDLNGLRVPPPRAKPYGYLAVQEKVSQFRDFINALDLQTKRRIEKIGYNVGV